MNRARDLSGADGSFAATTLTQIFGRAAGALFGRDGLDDEAAGQFWIERDFGAVERGVHEGNDFGIVESGRA
jgi:hypothetical protein